jgi:hypothetical protein
MAKPQWKDESKYGEGVRSSTMEYPSLRLRLTVHRYVGCGEQWFGTCFKLGEEKVPMGEIGTSLDEAKVMFTDYIAGYVSRLHAALVVNR